VVAALVTHVSDGDAIARIALAGAIGVVLGIERLLRGNPAGPRTFGLLAMGSAAFSVVAVGFNNDGRVIAGVATGVGFIGAGMIFHDSAHGVVGFATAAASWAVVAMGVLAGVGHAWVALAFAGMSVFLLELQYMRFTSWIASHTSLHRVDDMSDPRHTRREGPEEFNG
jgi:putative Mg2+ transporter-C (MgtC) family protein